MKRKPNANLLQQYGEAQFNFVLLHEYDAVRTHRWSKKEQREVALKNPLPIGKAPKDSGWPNKSVSFELAHEHMRSGKNVGVQMATAGYVVLDYDPRNDPDVGTEKNSLTRLLRDTDLLGVKHARVDTPSGGAHIYLKAKNPEWRGVVNGHAVLSKGSAGSKPGYPGIEFKHGRGHQVVAAGSIHPNGGMYQYAPDSVPMSDAVLVTDKLLKIFEIKKPEGLPAEASDNGWGLYSPKSIGAALSKLPVENYNGNHDKWLQLMMAVHWASGGEAVDEFVLWSCQDPEYSSDDETHRERWDSLCTQADARGNDVVTHRTLFQHLKEADVPVEVWPREKLELAFSDLEAEDFISDTSSDDDESEEARVLKIMNHDHALIAAGREPQYLKPGLSSVDEETMVMERASRATMAALYANTTLKVSEVVNGQLITERKTWFEFWHTHPQRRQYIGEVFKPSSDFRDVPAPNGKGYFYNTFDGWPYSRRNRGTGDWTLFREIIHKVLAGGNNTWFNYIIRWMAYSLQNPEGAQGVLMVFKGPKGVGKSIVADRWKQCFGSAGKMTQRMDDITGRFNSAIRSCSALLLEEGLWAGDKAAENQLKQLVTGESIQTEAKFADSMETRNNLAIIMCTNNQWAVPATPDERRFAVFEAVPHWPQNDEYFARVVREMDYEGGMQAFFYDLYTMDLEGWRPHANIPQTPALLEQMATTGGPMAEWWGATLELGVCPYSMDANTGGAPDWGASPIYVHYNELRQAFLNSMAQSQRGKWSRNLDQTFLKEWGDIAPFDPDLRKLTHPDTEEFFGVPGSAGTSRSGKPRSRFVYLPALDECIEFGKRRGVMVGGCFSKPEDNEDPVFPIQNEGSEDEGFGLV